MSEFNIYPVTVGAGQIALSPIPGRSGSYETDLTALLRWEPALVLTMTTQAELDRMGATDLGDDLAFAGIAWRHLPIVDFGAPGAEITTSWPHVSRLAHGILARGGRVLSHCFGGCGRSGTMALRL
ncbi:MAG: protein phosphatase, partial [Pseudomonadota bacterium]